MMICSSSGENAPFLRLGLRWFAQRSLQLLPHLNNPEFLCTEFQFPSPCFFTYSTRMASSAGVQGPFLTRPLTSPSSFVVALLSSPVSSLVLSLLETVRAITATIHRMRGRALQEKVVYTRMFDYRERDIWE